jgi:hypothetical protein
MGKIKKSSSRAFGKIGYCDNCGRKTHVKRLPLGGGAGAFLCSGCWSKEMKWRKGRNKDLDASAKFDLLSFRKSRMGW